MQFFKRTSEMRKLTNLTGKRFGRLIAIKFAGKDKWNNIRWLCQCDCGNKKIVQRGHLASGHTKSCGCWMRDRLTIHGYSKRCKKDRTHQIWESMIKRCTKPNHQSWKHYGGRKITVCKQWLNSFENFLKDMGKAPKGLQLDRINNNKGYYPKNCRWTTKQEQARNRRNNRLITYNGKTRTMIEWSEKTGIAYNVLVARISRYKWSPEKALTIPVRDHKRR